MNNNNMNDITAMDLWVVSDKANQLTAEIEAEELYKSIIKEAKAAALDGKYEITLGSDKYPKLYNQLSHYCRIKMVKILEDRFKKGNFKFKYYSYSDRYSSDHYTLSWEGTGGKNE